MLWSPDNGGHEGIPSVHVGFGAAKKESRLKSE